MFSLLGQVFGVTIIAAYMFNNFINSLDRFNQL